MESSDYCRDIVVSCSAYAAYRAVTCEYDKWWTPDAGSVFSVGDTIKFVFDSTYWLMRANALAPDYIELECIEACHVHPGLPESIRKEWEGTKLKWKIQEQNGRTKITLKHEGLVPALECFEICKQGWDFFFVSSLEKYLTAGRGLPYGTGIS